MCADNVVSIIVPVFNAGQYLESCIDSLIGQDYPYIEIILVNDGSTDNSLEICLKKQKEDPRVKCVSQVNKGVSSARNRGLALAEGDYVTFVDSDDTVTSDYVSHLLFVMNDNSDLSISGYKHYDSSKAIFYSTSEKTSGASNSIDFLVQLYQPTICDYVGYVWDKLYKMSIIRENGILFDEDICYNEDRLFLCAYLCSIRGLVSWNMKPTYNYFSRDSGAMNSLSGQTAHLFLTDLKAMIRMNEMALPQNRELALMAENSLLMSYHTICSLIDNRSKSGLKWKARLMIAKSIGFLRSLKLFWKLHSSGIKERETLN